MSTQLWCMELKQCPLHHSWSLMLHKSHGLARTDTILKMEPREVLFKSRPLGWITIILMSGFILIEQCIQLDGAQVRLQNYSSMIIQCCFQRSTKEPSWSGLHVERRNGLRKLFSMFTIAQFLKDLAMLASWLAMTMFGRQSMRHSEVCIHLGFPWMSVSVGQLWSQSSKREPQALWSFQVLWAVCPWLLLQCSWVESKKGNTCSCSSACKCSWSLWASILPNCLCDEVVQYSSRGMSHYYYPICSNLKSIFVACN